MKTWSYCNGSCRIMAAAAALCGIGQTLSAAPIVVIQETFQRTDWSNPFGTAPNMVNLPGGVWAKTAGYSAFTPNVAPAAWASTPTKTLIMGSGGTSNTGNTNVGVAVPLTGYRPTTISVDIKMLWTNNTTYGSLALGFYGTTLPAANTSGVGHLTGFTGVSVSRNGTMTLYEHGVSGTSVASGVNISWGSLRTLSYDIDTNTGAISNIILGGSSISGINSSAFTTAATVHAAAVASNSPGGYSQTVLDEFKVMGEIIPEPASLTLIVAGTLLIALRKRDGHEA